MDGVRDAGAHEHGNTLALEETLHDQRLALIAAVDLDQRGLVAAAHGPASNPTRFFAARVSAGIPARWSMAMPAERETTPFDYGLAAELFMGRRKGRARQPLSYRRFATAAEAAVLVTLCLCQNIRRLGWLSIALCTGTITTVAVVIAAGLANFDSRL